MKRREMFVGIAAFCGSADIAAVPGWARVVPWCSPQHGIMSGSTHQISGVGSGPEAVGFFRVLGSYIKLKKWRVYMNLPGLAGLRTWLLAAGLCYCLRLCIYFN